MKIEPPYRKNLGSLFTARQAKKHGIKVTPLDDRWIFMILKKGKTEHLLASGAITDVTSASALRLVHNKERTYRYLKPKKYPIPDYKIVETRKEAEDFFKRHKRIVLKPVAQAQGRGVVANIKGLSELKNAWTEVTRYTNKPLVEQYIDGIDLRVLVIGYEKVFAVKRTSPLVTGDGKNTVKELIRLKNRGRGKGLFGPKPIVLNKPERDFMLTQGRRLNDVLPEGEVLYFSRVANYSRGGDNEVWTSRLSPAIKKEAIRLAKDLRMTLVGIDYLVTDKKRYIIELNASPGFSMHHKPTHGEPEYPADAFLEFLFPKK